jgi:hypothetical protein
MKDELRSRTPDAIVNSGDCVRTHRAVKYIGENQFVHVHDNAEIHLFVEIINKDGLCQIIDTPIVMYGATRLTYRLNNEKIYSILERVRRHHGLSRINYLSTKNVSKNFTMGGPAHNALYRAMDISERFLPRVLTWLRSHSNRRANIGIELLQALDDACMLGYSWAYAEAGQYMRPLVDQI